ncbi:hypothetical protein [Longitalea arenae]|uniref:hypothetical protein n=1 Tax=Longitalea arenae TaxID=2812558 RepID=UPI001966F60E|nr:hypothetical protein [Longitalea arenae]
MQYMSPFAYFGETLPAPLDKKAIQLARKKLFAELELSGEMTIELQGKQLSRNDIIQYFDTLLKEDVLSYHSAIGADAVLLNFLEQAIIGPKEMFLDNPLYEDERFIQWVSPYFCHSFLAFMTNCFLVEPDEDGLVSLLANKHFMTAADARKAWDAVVRILMDDIATLDQYHQQAKNNKAASLAPIEYLMEFRYIRLIQLLPEDRFASISDSYAHSMLLACIDTFNNNNDHRDTVRTWLENAELLAVSAEIKAGIHERLSELDAMDAPAPAKKSESSPLKFIIIAVILVIRLATCKTNSSTTYNHTPVVFPQTTPWNQQRVLDSLKMKYPHMDWETIHKNRRDMDSANLRILDTAR